MFSGKCGRKWPVRRCEVTERLSQRRSLASGSLAALTSWIHGTFSGTVVTEVGETWPNGHLEATERSPGGSERPWWTLNETERSERGDEETQRHRTVARLDVRLGRGGHRPAGRGGGRSAGRLVIASGCGHADSVPLSRSTCTLITHVCACARKFLRDTFLRARK